MLIIKIPYSFCEVSFWIKTYQCEVKSTIINLYNSYLHINIYYCTVNEVCRLVIFMLKAGVNKMKFHLPKTNLDAKATLHFAEI